MQIKKSVNSVAFVIYLYVNSYFETSAFTIPCTEISPRHHFTFSTNAETTLSRTLNNKKICSSHPNTSDGKLFMCICVDCARVKNCAAYHFVEGKHEQPHMTDSPTFEPRDGSPTVHVNIRTIRNEEDREGEIKRMWNAEKRLEGEGKGSFAVDVNSQDWEINAGKSDTGDQTFTPVTTYEYDVVECEDYVKDLGCWVRNMPEEIKIANPDFVPS